MHYLIYFDESNKLDQFNADYSYYGAYGGTDAAMARVVKQVRNIFKQCNSFSELHFREYTKDNLVKKYFQTLHTVINENVQINILTVNNRDALYAAQKIGLTATELRNLFYIKIPERLFYPESVTEVYQKCWETQSCRDFDSISNVHLLGEEPRVQYFVD